MGTSPSYRGRSQHRYRILPGTRTASRKSKSAFTSKARLAFQSGPKAHEGISAIRLLCILTCKAKRAVTIARIVSRDTRRRRAILLVQPKTSDFDHHLPNNVHLKDLNSNGLQYLIGSKLNDRLVRNFVCLAKSEWTNFEESPPFAIFSTVEKPTRSLELSINN